MTKKIFAFILALTFIFVTSSVFAANELRDSMDKTGNSMRNVVNGAGNVLQDAETAITDGAKNIGNAISTSADRLTGGMTGTDNMDDNQGYDATRTTTTRTLTAGTGTGTDNGTIMGMNENTWTWLILAITTLAIVGLVWYYAMQHKTEYTNRND